MEEETKEERQERLRQRFLQKAEALAASRTEEDFVTLKPPKEERNDPLKSTDPLLLSDSEGDDGTLDKHELDRATSLSLLAQDEDNKTMTTSTKMVRERSQAQLHVNALMTSVPTLVEEMNALKSHLSEAGQLEKNLRDTRQSLLRSGALWAAERESMSQKVAEGAIASQRVKHSEHDLEMARESLRNAQEENSVLLEEQRKAMEEFSRERSELVTQCTRLAEDRAQMERQWVQKVEETKALSKKTWEVMRQEDLARFRRREADLLGRIEAAEAHVVQIECASSKAARSVTEQRARAEGEWRLRRKAERALQSATRSAHEMADTHKTQESIIRDLRGQLAASRKEAESWRELLAQAEDTVAAWEMRAQEGWAKAAKADRASETLCQENKALKEENRRQRKQYAMDIQHWQTRMHRLSKEADVSRAQEQDARREAATRSRDAERWKRMSQLGANSEEDEEESVHVGHFTSVWEESDPLASSFQLGDLTGYGELRGKVEERLRASGEKDV